MLKRWILMVIMLMFALPSVLYAVDMGGMVFEVNIPTRSVGKVPFSHAKHGANCNQCHPKIFKKKNPRRRPVSMRQMEKGRACGACHNGKKAFSVTGDCVTCHAGDILFKDEDAGNVTFPHAAHVDMYGCDECHPDLFKARRGANKATMEDMESGKSCGACHDGDAAFSVAEDCESCHEM
jgi:c(7)-type cytochrome triheme protein